MSIPNFTLRIEDLAHGGVPVFLQAVNPNQALRYAVEASFKWLYDSSDKAPTNVEAILLVLRAMPGVAYTTGSHSHKEIHFSLDFILKSADRAKDEIMGVLVHEVVHCFQYNGLGGGCPGGLIEGIADWVRMSCNLSPPHWAKSYPPKKGDTWDAGYEKTAFFLLWIEQRYGDGSIRELNEMLKSDKYDKKIFKRLTGRKLDKLWSLYCTESGANEDDLVIIHRDDV